MAPPDRMRMVMQRTIPSSGCLKQFLTWHEDVATMKLVSDSDELVKRDIVESLTKEKERCSEWTTNLPAVAIL